MPQAHYTLLQYTVVSLSTQRTNTANGRNAVHITFSQSLPDVWRASQDLWTMNFRYTAVTLKNRY
jgi:hypothetical protein